MIIKLKTNYIIKYKKIFIIKNILNKKLVFKNMLIKYFL